MPALIGLAIAGHAEAQDGAVLPPLAEGVTLPHRGVVDDTWIVAPKRVPNASLSAIKNYAEEGDIAAGVSLRYHMDDADWIIADVFIYPAGEGDGKKMLQRAAEDFRESVAYAERQQIYRNVWWGDESAYTATLSGSKKLEGRFLPIVFDSQQDMLTSRAYLFYRKLYYVKIRLTTTVEAVDSLAERADRFVSSLLDGLEIASVGTCGHAANPASPEAPSTPAATAAEMKRQLVTGCTSLDYRPPADSASRAVLHLTFQPQDWGASRP